MPTKANYTLNTNVTATDRASKVYNKMARSFKKMTGTVKRESKVSENAFKKFSRTVSRYSKRALVSINNLEAGARRGFRRFSNSITQVKNLAAIAVIGAVIGNSVGIFAKFEQANANLASVMGKTVAETVALQIDAKRLGATTAKTATEVVGLQESLARLSFEEGDIINMTQSIIAGSIAMQGELSATADLTGAMVKSFDQFESINTPEIIDQMTLATQKSALNFEKLQIGLPIVAGAANAAGVSFTKLLASQGKLADAGIDASSSNTALRNIFLEAAKRGVPYEKLLKKVANSTDKLKVANDLFGKRGAVASVILAKNIDKIDKLDKVLQKAGGTAEKTAAKQLDTLTGSVTILGSAWEGFILSLEDGTGSFSKFLKISVQVVTEMLSLLTGTEKATEKLNEQQLRVRNLANMFLSLLRVVRNIAIAYIAFKTAMLVARAAMVAYNIVGGITIALTKGAVLATNAARAAQIAYSVTMGVITAAQWLYTSALVPAIAATWLFTKALLSNPTTWIVVGIVALIAAIVSLVVYWDEVTAAVSGFYKKIKNNAIDSFLLAPIIAVIDSIIFLVDNFGLIKTATIDFFNIVKDSPITKFLLFPIFTTIDAIKLLIANFDAIKSAIINFIALSVRPAIDAVKFLIENFDNIKTAIISFYDIIRENAIVKFLLAPIFAVIDGIKFLIANFNAIKLAVIGFYDTIRESVIAKFLLAPIILVIEATKLLIDGIKSALEYFNLLESKEVKLKVIKSKEEAGRGVLKLTDKEIKDADIRLKDGFSLGFVEQPEPLKTKGLGALTSTYEATLVDKNIAKEDKIIAATDKNTTAINENTQSSKKEWKGRFTTSILRDANISDKVNVSNEVNKTVQKEVNVSNPAIKTAQREIAISGISRELKNTSVQNSIINNNNVQSGPSEVITPFSGSTSNQSDNKNLKNNKSDIQQIFISVVDKTGGQFGLEVESTGVDVNITGN